MTHPILNEFLRRAAGRGQTPKQRGEEWRMPCLKHGGDDYNLAVRMGDKGLIAKCWSEDCASEDIALAYGYEGIHEWFIDNGHERRPTRAERARASAKAAAPKITRYEIRDPDTGEVLATHVRKDASGQKKKVWWEPSGIKPEALPLYGAHDLRDEAEQVIVTEGEKARDALQSWGIPAVGTVTGAGGCPCAASMEILRGRDVILWPDKDEEGTKHMVNIALALEGVARSVRLVRPPAGKCEKWDAADAAEEEARRLITDAVDLADVPEPDAGATDEDEPTILYHLSADEIRAMTFPDADWLVDGFILRDSVTVIHAPPKEGKSTLLYSLAGRLAHGDAEWAGFKLVGKSCTVLYLSESSARIVKSHVIKHDLGVNVIFAPNEERSVLLNAEQVLGGVAQLAEMYEPDMLVVDTMTSWGRIVGESENDSVVMQRVADAYRRFAANGCAVVIVHHSNKGGDLSPVQSLRGSSATAGAVDCLTRIFDPTNGKGGTRRKVWTLGRMDEQNWQRWVDWDDLARTFNASDAPDEEEDGLLDEDLERFALAALDALARENPGVSGFGYKRIATRAASDNPEKPARAGITAALDRMRKARPPRVLHGPKGYSLAPDPAHETPPLPGADT